MGEVVSFSLTLDERVAGPAKKAADALRAVEKSADKAQSALSGKFANSWEKIGFAAERSSMKQNSAFAGSWSKIGMAAGRAHERVGAAAEKAASRQQNAFAASWAKIGMSAERARRQQHKAMERKKERDEEKAKEHSLLGGIKEGVGFSRFTSAAFAGSFLAEGAMKIGETLIEAAHKVIEIFTDGFKEAIAEGSKEQTKRQQFGLSLGTKEGAESFVDIDRFAKQTQFTKDEIQPMILKLRRAGFDQKAARSAFAVAADIDAAGGMKAADYVDFAEHLKLKGGVSKKQLLSANINVPEFFKALGKTHGISAATAEKQAEEGGHFDPQEMLNLIQKGVEKRQGGEGGTGAGVASDRLETRIKKLKALPGEYLENVVDTPAFKKLSDAFGGLLEKLNPEGETGQRIIASIESMFNKIIGWFDQLTSENGLDSITEGVGSLVEGLGKAVDVATMLVHAFEAVAGVAVTVSKPLGDLMAFGERLAHPTNGFNSEDELKQDLMKKYASGKITLDDVTKIAGQYAGKFDNQSAPAVSGDKPAGKVIHMHNHVTTNVHAAPGEDPNHTHRKAGEETHRHTLNALEKAGQEGGG